MKVHEPPCVMIDEQEQYITDWFNYHLNIIDGLCKRYHEWRLEREDNQKALICMDSFTLFYNTIMF